MNEKGVLLMKSVEVLDSYEKVEIAVESWQRNNHPNDYAKGKTFYKAALLALGFTEDGYDEYGSKAYYNGQVRVAVFYDHGDCCWYMEKAQGRTDTTDNFYNTPNDEPDIYGNY